MAGTYYATDLLPGEHLSEEQTELYSIYFQNSVDYERIKIHNSQAASKLMELRGVTALAFRNRIIMGPKDEDATTPFWSKSDITTEDYRVMHEMAHMWQIQNCGQYAVTKHAIIQLVSAMAGDNGVYGAYEYDLSSGRDLSTYGIEQQASIITNYYLLSESFPNAPWEGRAPLFDTTAYSSARDMRPYYEETLSRFLEDPAYIQDHCPHLE